MQYSDAVLAAILIDETDDEGEELPTGYCSACGWRVTDVTRYRSNGRPVRVCTCTGEVVDGDGRYAGCLARFMPPVEIIPRNLPDGDQFASYLTGTGQTDLGEGLPFGAGHDIAPARANLGYSVEVIAPDDEQEIRVRQAVRNFGFLARRRDIDYAASVGMDLGEFVTGIVHPETDQLASDGAGLPIYYLPSRKRMRRPLGHAAMRLWRKRTGRSGGVSERQRG